MWVDMWVVQLTNSPHGRPQEFFQGGAKILRWQKCNFVYKTKLLSAKKSSMFHNYVLRFSGYLD